jgi:hypothetical protein
MKYEVMAPFPGWNLDHNRNQYYYYSEEEGAYIYQSGEKIYIHGYVSLRHCRPLHSNYTNSTLSAVVQIVLSNKTNPLKALVRLAPMVQTITEPPVEEMTQYKAWQIR